MRKQLSFLSLPLTTIAAVLFASACSATATDPNSQMESCSNPSQADGTPCDDGNACTQGDVCSAGVCVGVGVICTASDLCHDAGTCDPQTGSCSNPNKVDGTQCDDGNACTQGDVCSAGVCSGPPLSCASSAAPDDCHVGACQADGSCGLANAPDGMSCCGMVPAAHCTGEFHGTCQAGACTNLNACGDGVIEFALGESCDDGNHSIGDGCDANCHVEPFVTTVPIKVSGDLSCSTAIANVARKIAVDSSGNVYAVMKCGTSGFVAVSTDRGRSFSGPLALPADIGTSTSDVAQVAVATGPSGVAYIAIMLTNGQVFIHRTKDRGATWSQGASIGTATSTTAGLSLVAFNDDLYIGFRSATGITVARNHQQGAGTFDVTDVAMSVSFFDLVFDVRLGTLVVSSDSPTFHVRVSSDAGVTFGSEVNPPGSEFFSDWTIGNGTIFVAGTKLVTPDNSVNLYKIPSNAPGTSTFVAGLPSVSASQTRSIAADDVGNVFVASQLNSGGVQLDRLAADSTTFDAPRLIDPAGSSPIPAPLPGGSGAAIAYTVGTAVWVTVQAY